MQMGPTDQLAHYVARAKFEDFPREVVAKAKACIQDAVGCALGAAQTELGRRYIESAKNSGGQGPCTVIGDGARISCLSAAQANTDLTSLLDFDDMHWLTLTHPGCAVVCSALAVVEMTGGSGRDFITAVIVGYEAGLRIGRAIRSVVSRPDGKQEVMSNPSYIAFASAAAASKALGLTAEQTAHAFGLAGNTPINRGQSQVHFGGVNAHPYTDNKYDMGTHSLLGVHNSIRARRLAGPRNVLDADRYWSRCGANTCNHAELTAGLGEKYRILEIAFKPMCFGAVAGAPVTAVWRALGGERPHPEDIEEIRLTGIPRLECYEWNNMVEAEFSTPCAVAMAVAGEKPGPRWFNSGRYMDPDIFAIANKVKFVEDPEARALALQRGQWPCTVAIRMRDGSVRMARAEYEKGAPENPFTEQDSLQKFLLNSEDLLGRSSAGELWAQLWRLETIGAISEVCGRLTGGV